MILQLYLWPGKGPGATREKVIRQIIWSKVVKLLEDKHGYDYRLGAPEYFRVSQRYRT